MRIHPAASRVRMLAEPDAVVLRGLRPAGRLGDEDLRRRPSASAARAWRQLLAKSGPPVYVTPSTTDRDLAQDWFERFEGAGLDGVVAKRLDEPYKPGARAMMKIKHLRTVDCVVGGYRWNRGEEGDSVGSLLLGLYDDEGVFHHVGHTSSFKAQEKRELVELPGALRRARTTGDGFGKGRTPGEPSRWTGDRDMTWMRLRPELVCEVTFDYLQGQSLPPRRHLPALALRQAAARLRLRPDRDDAALRAAGRSSRRGLGTPG